MKKSVNKKYLILPIFVLIIFSINLILIKAADTTPTKYTSQYFREKLGTEEIKNFLVGIFGPLYGSTDPMMIFMCILVTLIFYGIAYDFLDLASIISSNLLKITISIGVAIMAIWLGWPIDLALWGLGFFTFVGAFGFLFEILAIGAVMVGLIFGNQAIAKWAARRKASAAIIRSIKTAGSVRGAITGLKEIGRELG